MTAALPLTGTPSPTATLPRPARERFQPLRSGVVNLYRYDDQEFWFEDGHLLLRGNNGTGKSRVLALQLPFLFDGDVAPHRMEPDGDVAKKVEWNLLMGGRHADRLGYTWLEFGRKTSELASGEEFVTLGCGLSAAGGRAQVGKWFFVTRQRVGRDLFLVAPTGQALSRERLTEAIGAEGSVHVTAVDYRRAVDEALFGLGKARYEALINLLIQLRQPQLSRQLDETRLSEALSEALTPPAPQIVAEVAGAFRALEADRDALEGFRNASRAVEQFLHEYRRYAQIAARRRAAAVRTRQAAYAATMRRLREAERKLEAGEAEERAAAAEMAQAKIDEEAATATKEALAASPAMQDAQALRRAREAAERGAHDAALALREAERRGEVLTRREREQKDAAAAAESAQADLAVHLERMAVSAEAVGVKARHEKIVAKVASTDKGGDSEGDEALRALAALLEERRRALRHIGTLAEELRRADATLEQAEASTRVLEADTDEAALAQRSAAVARTEVADRTFAAYRAWAVATQVLSPIAAEEIVDAFAGWAEEATGSSPIANAVAASLAAALERTGAARSAIAAQIADARVRWDELTGERSRLLAGAHRPPLAPPSRDESLREAWAGAPLWRLVDFADEVSQAQRAGLEGAIEAAGILDAWVTPDGRLLGPGENDVLLLDAGAPLEDGAHLGLVLRPTMDRRDPRVAGISDDRIVALLARIGLGISSGAHAAVDTDGRFRLGPLDGRYEKPVAEHIGEGAREAARRRRLKELDVEIGRIEEERRWLDRKMTAVDAAVATARAEASAAPDDQPVRAAAAALEAAGRTLQTVRGRLGEAQAHAAKSSRDARRTARDQAAADLGLTAFVADLATLEASLAEYAGELKALFPALAYVRSVRRRLTEAIGSAEEARAEAGEAAERVIELRGRAAALAAERDVLDSSVGAAAEQILARFGEAQALVRELRAMREAIGKCEREAHDRCVRARAEAEQARLDLGQDESLRSIAATSLERLGGTRLLTVAVPELGKDFEDTGGGGEAWSVTRTVEVARKIEALLERVDAADAAWERSGKGLFAHVQTLEQALLPQGHQASTSLADDLVVVEMPFQGRLHTMAEFGDIVANEVTNRQMLLSARERETLENHLVGEVSMHLHDRLHEAERLVREMNDELASRPMSTGMTLRFSWKPIEDGPQGLLEARKRLMRSGGTWSAAEREALGGFLSKRIADVRASNLGGTWQDHLAEALDYATLAQLRCGAPPRRAVEASDPSHAWHRLGRREGGGAHAASVRSGGRPLSQCLRSRPPPHSARRGLCGRRQ